MASALKSFLFFLHSTAVMMMIMSVTTAMGANTAASIHRLLGGFLTTAEKGKTLLHDKTSRSILHTHAKWHCIRLNLIHWAWFSYCRQQSIRECSMLSLPLSPDQLCLTLFPPSHSSEQHCSPDKQCCAGSISERLESKELSQPFLLLPSSQHQLFCLNSAWVMHCALHVCLSMFLSFCLLVRC